MYYINKIITAWYLLNNENQEKQMNIILWHLRMKWFYSLSSLEYCLDFGCNLITLEFLIYLELLIMYTKTVSTTENPHSYIPSNYADYRSGWIDAFLQNQQKYNKLPTNSCIHLCVQQVSNECILVHYFFALQNPMELPLNSLGRKDWSINEVTQ